VIHLLVFLYNLFHLFYLLFLLLTIYIYAYFYKHSRTGITLSSISKQSWYSKECFGLLINYKSQELLLHFMPTGFSLLLILDDILKTTILSLLPEFNSKCWTISTLLVYITKHPTRYCRWTNQSTEEVYSIIKCFTIIMILR
jgi:hypothetical protein